MLDMAAEIRLRRCRLIHSFASPHIQGGRWTETIRQQASPSRDVVEKSTFMPAALPTSTLCWRAVSV